MNNFYLHLFVIHEMLLVSVIYRQRVVYADSNVVLILTCLPNDLNGSNGKGSKKIQSQSFSLDIISTFLVYGWIATTSWDTTEQMVEPAFQALAKCGIPREAMIRQNNTGCAASYETS